MKISRSLGQADGIVQNLNSFCSPIWANCTVNQSEDLFIVLWNFDIFCHSHCYSCPFYRKANYYYPMTARGYSNCCVRFRLTGREPSAYPSLCWIHLDWTHFQTYFATEAPLLLLGKYQISKLFFLKHPSLLCRPLNLVGTGLYIYFSTPLLTFLKPKKVNVPPYINLLKCYSKDYCATFDFCFR
jgi:hypothetical protein